MNISKILVLTTISISSSTAYAFNDNLLTILVKIYQQASAPKEVSQNPENATVEPENFSASKGSKSTTASSNTQEATSTPTDVKNQNLTPSELFEVAKVQHANGVKAAKLAAQEAKIKAQNPPKAEDTESGDYIVDFNKRHLTNQQFKKIYYGSNSPIAHPRIKVTINNVTEREIVYIEQSLEMKEHLNNYHRAFQIHIKNVVKDLSLSFVELRNLSIKGDPDVQSDFNLNPAGDAIQIKNIWAGVTNYEITHNLDTHCLYGIGGDNQYLSDCDEILATITTNYIKTHGHINSKLTKQDLIKIAHAINPRESLD